MSALKSFLPNVPALSHSYSCGFNGGETSWLGKWDSISWATPQAINHRQQLLQPSSLWLQTLTSWNNILLGVASLDGSQLLAGWWKEDKIYCRPCRIWVKILTTSYRDCGITACVTTASFSEDQRQIQGGINPLENQFPCLSVRPAVSGSWKLCVELNWHLRLMGNCLKTSFNLNDATTPE